MNPADFVVLAVIAALVFLAIRSMRKRKKSGHCCGGACAGCQLNCGRKEQTK